MPNTSDREQKHVWESPVTAALSAEYGIGITKHSLEIFAQNKKELGAVEQIELLMPYGKEYGDTFSRFINAKGAYVQLDGLTWGYSGEGPHGLLEILKQCDVDISIETIADWRSEHLHLRRQQVTGGWFVKPFCNCKELLTSEAKE